MVDLTASTQSDLAELVNSSVAKSGEVIAAEFQSNGRGRLDRTFEAPPQSALLFSFYIAPQRARSDWSFISFLAALAMREVITENLVENTTLKWPNDILIGDKKVAGLLAQQIGDGVIVGIGLNGIGSALYITCALGPGPRDGWMTSLHRRSGIPVGRVRTAIEISVLLAGWALGGRIGLGTALFALLIGYAVAAGFGVVSRITKE